MDITPLVPEELHTISRYGDGGFTIQGKDYQGAILVYADGVTPFDGDNTTFTQSMIEQLIQYKDRFELVLLGTGASHTNLDSQIIEQLRQHAIRFDVMATGAACRTYNVLLTEGRKAAAALLPA